MSIFEESDQINAFNNLLLNYEESDLLGKIFKLLYYYLDLFELKYRMSLIKNLYIDCR